MFMYLPHLWRDMCSNKLNWIEQRLEEMLFVILHRFALISSNSWLHKLIVDCRVGFDWKKERKNKNYEMHWKFLVQWEFSFAINLKLWWIKNFIQLELQRKTFNFHQVEDFANMHLLEWFWGKMHYRMESIMFINIAKICWINKSFEWIFQFQYWYYQRRKKLFVLNLDEIDWKIL